MPSFMVSLIAGGAAGTAVDVGLYPLDTIKTRMQSPEGFFKAGGFRGVYNGLSAAAGGSAPGAAAFFATYEYGKQELRPYFPEDSNRASIGHMLAASAAEMMACVVRVPTENVKQNLQAGVYKHFSTAVRTIYQTQGVSGFWVGYNATVLREIPFSFIQFPLYEFSKKVWARKKKRSVSPWEAAICGSVAGGFSACVTTPLDVAKTRIMLRNDSAGVPYKGFYDTMTRVNAEGGMKALFAGVVPRTIWISIGGLMFFGMYEFMLEILDPNHRHAMDT